MNQTFESVEVEVPTASLPPVVQVGKSPGAFGAFWAEAGAARNANRMKSAANARRGGKWPASSLTLLARAEQAHAPTGKILTVAKDVKGVRFTFQEIWESVGRTGTVRPSRGDRVKT